MHQSLRPYVCGIAAGHIFNFNHLCSKLSKPYYHHKTEAIKYLNFIWRPGIMIMDIDSFTAGK